MEPPGPLQHDYYNSLKPGVHRNTNFKAILRIRRIDLPLLLQLEAERAGLQALHEHGKKKNRQFSPFGTYDYHYFEVYCPEHGKSRGVPTGQLLRDRGRRPPARGCGCEFRFFVRTDGGKRSGQHDVVLVTWPETEHGDECNARAARGPQRLSDCDRERIMQVVSTNKYATASQLVLLCNQDLLQDEMSRTRAFADLSTMWMWGMEQPEAMPRGRAVTKDDIYNALRRLRKTPYRLHPDEANSIDILVRTCRELTYDPVVLYQPQRENAVRKQKLVARLDSLVPVNVARALLSNALFSQVFLLGLMLPEQARALFEFGDIVSMDTTHGELCITRAPSRLKRAHAMNSSFFITPVSRPSLSLPRAQRLAAQAATGSASASRASSSRTTSSSGPCPRRS
jgi:hypothetical protein